MRNGVPPKSMMFGFLLFMSCWMSHSLFAGVTYDLPLTAEVKTLNNVLTWTTSEESNNDFFVVERSTDGLTFERAVQITAAGNSQSTKRYRFVDIEPVTNRTFYRLLQVDFDGTTQLSHVVVVDNQDSGQLFSLKAINTSSTDRYLSMAMEASIDHELMYQVMDMQGQVQKEGTSRVIDGTNLISIDLQTLSVGTYRLALKVRDELDILTIQKVDGAIMPDANLATKSGQE